MSAFGQAVHHHRVHVAYAKSPGQPCAAVADGAANEARACGQKRLLSSQQPIVGLLPDLLGLRASHHRAFADGACHATRDARDGASHRSTHCTTGQHRRNGLGHVAQCRHGVGNTSLEGVNKPIGLLDGFFSGLLFGRQILPDALADFLGVQPKALRHVAGLAAR